MNYKEKRKNNFNVWTAFTDMALCFLIIILIVFIVNTKKLNQTLKEKEELASYAEAAICDKKELIESLRNDEDLAKMLRSVPGLDESAKQDTVIVFSGDLIWEKDDQSEINQLPPNATETVKMFGGKLKEFLDKNDTKHNDLYRYKTYTVLIIGHASHDGYENEKHNYDLSQKRANSIRDYLFLEVFNKVGDKDKYKILATGYGDKHLRKLGNKVRGDKCVEIVFKYDEMDMVQGFN